MAPTVTPDSPIAGDLTPERIADLIDQAATLIHDNGLEVGNYWPDALLRPYEPGDCCCTVGALAVVCGYRNPVDIEDDFVGIGHYDPETGETGPDHPHSAFAAAMSALGFRQVEDVYNWSDTAGDREVVDALREAAAKIRAQAGGAA